MKVLDYGHVEYVDCMGSDLTVANAARVSFNKETEWDIDEAAKKRLIDSGSVYHESDLRVLSVKDTKLIQYLAKHNHWTPFAHPQITLRVKAPISIRTQLFKHKVGFCLSGDTKISLLIKGGKDKSSNGVRLTSINDLYHMWMQETPHSRCGDLYGYRKEIMGYDIRVLNTDTSIFEKGHITNIVCNGMKEVFLITTKDGKTVKMTKDHRIYTKNGWETLESAVGLKNSCGIYGMTKVSFIGINGMSCVGNGLYRDYDWMKEQREMGYGVEVIASNAGCSYHTIRKWLKIHNLKFDHLKNLNKGDPWNKGLKGYRAYTLEEKLEQSKRLLEYHKNHPQQKQSTTWRQEVNRWTSQVSHLVHEKNGYTCQECGCRGKKLNAHHIIPVLVDSTKAKDIENLISVCIECHHKIHSTELSSKEFAQKVLTQSIILTEWKKKGQRKGLRVHFTEIVKIESVGEEVVFDISVDHKSHNFVANGMVVHNCENEISRRYVSDEPEIYHPRWRTSPTNGAKQGSEDFLEYGETWDMCGAIYDIAIKSSVFSYNMLIEKGIAPEQARFVLPQGTYTEWWWTGSLAAYARVCKLRSDSHAQWEVQQYAEAISKIIEPLFPVSWKALTEK
jgi:thymidylate synthase (FAD)